MKQTKTLKKFNVENSNHFPFNNISVDKLMMTLCLINQLDWTGIGQYFFHTHIPAIYSNYINFFVVVVPLEAEGDIISEL